MLLIYFTFAVSFTNILPILKVSNMKCTSQHHYKLSKDIGNNAHKTNMAESRAFRNWPQSLLQHYTHTHSQQYNYWHSPFNSLYILILIQSRAASVSEIQPRLSSNPTIHDLQSWSWKSIRCVSTDSSALDIQMDQVNCFTLK